MKLKNSYFYTLRENVKDEDSVSGNLLSRAGMIKRNSAGIYMYLPLGYRVLKKIEKIVREEMDQARAQEVLMPALIPEDIFVKSGRRDVIGSSMFALKDRFEKPFVLAPTHEELFAVAAGMKIRSYKDLPFNLYQFQTKFRDEKRPRFGLIRVKEFIMKDAYSFDSDLAGLDVAYQKMFEAYHRVFQRLDLKYCVVQADTGIMGGLLSEEFQAFSEIGEDIIVLCDHCGYASNLEVSQCVSETHPNNEALAAKEKIFTPDTKTIEELVNFLGLSADKFVKTLIYRIDQQFVACLVRGDREINETKVLKLFNGHEIELASAEDVINFTHANVGFAGPIGLKLPIVIDNDVAQLKNFIVGANETDYHYINVNLSDFNINQIADIKLVAEQDPCPNCGHPLHFETGIEIGNTFKLGTKYSQLLDLYYLDANNQRQPVVMGSYGLGLGRCLAALVEQKHQADNLVFPMNVAPYQVAIVVANYQDEQQNEIAEQLYDTLTKAKIEVILDNRSERAGVKFKDIELIGIPIRITVGKHIVDEKVELKLRQADNQLIKLSDVLKEVQQLIQNEWK